MARLQLNHAELNHFMEAEGIHTRLELARRMHVAPSTITRLMDGTLAPGQATLAGFKAAFPGRNTDSLTSVTR